MARTKQVSRVVEEGDSSAPPRPRRGTGQGQQPVPPCVQNPDFSSQLAKWAKRKLIPEKGINISELGQTPIPQTVERRGWQTYVQHPPKYCRRIVEEFYAGMVPRSYLLGGAVWVRGKEVKINASAINRYFRTSIPEEEREGMFKGLTKNSIFTKMNVELANDLTDHPLPFWNARSSPLKQSKIHIDLAFWHVFISYSLRPCGHRTTIAYEVAQLLYCLHHGQPLDIGVLIKMEIHKCGKDESGKEAMGFPSLITHFCMQAGVDLSAEEMKEPPSDLGIHQWHSLFPSRGLRKPEGHKRARTEDAGADAEAEDSEPEAEDSEPEDEEGHLLSEDDERHSLWTRMLKALKRTRRLEMKEQAAAHAEQVKQIREAKEEILREIAASEGRTMAVISEVEDGLMQDFAELRTELRVSPYCRQKKTRPVPSSRSRPIGGPVISEEDAQMRIALERSLKEQADREAASSRGKEKLPGSS